MQVCTLSVYDQPLAANVCDQLLRELGSVGNCSLAHVAMNPLAWSLLHKHDKMEEMYIITRGTGHLVCGDRIYLVKAGDAIRIPAGTPHQLVNIGLGTLEHLVLASPPFDPDDVTVLDTMRPVTYGNNEPFSRPPVEECFDGARIVSYQFADASIAFGWVRNDPQLEKRAHFHKKTEEWIYVTEGHGEMRIDNRVIPVSGGDLCMIEAGNAHAIRCGSDQNMVVVCICTPRFDMADVHYR